MNIAECNCNDKSDEQILSYTHSIYLGLAFKGLSRVIYLFGGSKEKELYFP